MTEKYPYLFYLENSRIIFDRDGFLQSIFDKSRNYLETHPEVFEFWRTEYELMRKQKELGEKPDNFIDVCDKAEIRFSSHHTVKRNVLTSEFFHRHKKS